MNKADAMNNIYRESAWKHFSVHADQRLKMFQFYITISTALLGGVILLYRTGENAEALLILCFLISFFSFVFWKLEKRTSTLVKNAEDAIKYLDSSVDVPDIEGQPNPLKLFTRDDFRTQNSKNLSHFSHFSYHRCFVWVFVAIGVLGAIGMFIGFMQIFCSANMN